jgi:hypothetical protein
MTTSLSSTSPYLSGSTFEHGSNSFHPKAFVVGQSSSRFSSGTARGRTCVPKTPRTLRVVSRSLASPCGTTSAGSLGSAILYRTPSTQMSPARSSLKPPTSPSFISSAVESRVPPASS